jgi:CRISPR system Cascade subunit CasA
MNLVEDSWIPVRRSSGAVLRIAPWQITDKYQEDPIERLAAPRPDFNGALIQFLIGLLQTCVAPNDNSKWRQCLSQPPNPEKLRKAFSDVLDAFQLDGEGPRFLQDLTLEAELNQMGPSEYSERKRPIGELLIEVPGGKTLKDNTDHFIKRGGVEKLCLYCAATALFSLQTNSPAGGQGNRTGLRGGGPLTTVLVAENLWKTCWLNVLNRDDFLHLTGNPLKRNQADRFPWLAPTRTSEGGRATTPNDVHPDQVFWSMPRRIRLLFSNLHEETSCDVCGDRATKVASYYLTKNLGINYEGPWVHPLSPYFVDNSGSRSPIHPQPGGIGYRHWLGLLQSSTTNKGRKEPARVVSNYMLRGQEDSRIWAFGYDMDNMKARCWYDCTMPLMLCDEQLRPTFEWCIAGLVRSADMAASKTREQVRKALFKIGTQKDGDSSFISERFWLETEPWFWEAAFQIRDALSRGCEIISFLQRWHKVLVEVAERIFDDLSQTGAFEAVDPKRIALARKELQKTLNGKKLLQQLGVVNQPNGT